MFEIFGIEMTIGWYIVVFTVCQFINVGLNTAKTIIMHKEEKISSSVINAVTYGFYAIIVVMTASALPLWITIVISALTNLFGVYGSMWLLDKFKKDKLWEIVATVQNTEMDNYKQFINMVLTREHISFNCIETNKQGEYVYHIYSENQKQSEIIKKVLSGGTNAKYIVHEERVRS
jgi:hypothetical protein